MKSEVTIYFLTGVVWRRKWISPLAALRCDGGRERGGVTEALAVLAAVSCRPRRILTVSFSQFSWGHQSSLCEFMLSTWSAVRAGGVQKCGWQLQVGCIPMAEH